VTHSHRLHALVLIPGGTPQAYWYAVGDLDPSSLSVGQLVEVSLLSRKVSGLVLEMRETSFEFDTKPILGLSPQAEKVPVAYLALLQWMAEYYLTPLPTVLATCLPKSAQRYLFHPPKKTRKTKVKPVVFEETAAPIAPNAEQAQAIQTVAHSIQSATFAPYLLHGVTGSGKTLVYQHLAKAALDLGKRVLILVPEIGLTPQTVSRFEAFLGRKVAAYHSQLGEAERRALWQGLFSGSVDIVIGPRSAALLPIDGLGLIVVDEEHDASFKQDAMSPRYHARDLCLWRGRQSHCPVVLGSATPSLETYQAAQAKRFHLLELTRMATGASRPVITVVDMRRQWELQGHQALSIPLRDALQAALERGEQAILFLNRRGYSPRRVCQSCGQSQTCRNCAVPLVFHKRRDLMLCHHCGWSQSPQSPCGFCGSREHLDAGRGLEQIEETLRALFPRFGVERLDRDVTQTVGGPEQVLQRFREGAFQILIGTQMIAKGHDFPRVSLVGVLDADAGLGMADFRAQERAFQLITQVSGRAGRHQFPGQVYLQTFNPDNPLLTWAIQQDYAHFFAGEIDRRRELNYPPFLRLLLIEMSSSSEADLLSALHAMADAMRPHLEAAEVAMLGPVPAAIRKLHGEWRGHILLKSASAKRLQWLVQTAKTTAEPQFPKKIKLRVDMDPQTLI
jgi:primosomal protein N' (replication factor Y) (superfamily II helicase)